MAEDLTDWPILLARHGAAGTAPALNDAEAAEGAFVAACMRLDRDLVRAQIEQHPEYLHSPKAVLAAALRDRADVVAFLLDLGVPLEIEDDSQQRTLHLAASHNALRVAQLLIERGAEVDPRETQWDATPIGFASYGEHDRDGRSSEPVLEGRLDARLPGLRRPLARGVAG